MQCISTRLIERHCLIEQAKLRRYVPRENVDIVKIYESLQHDSFFLKWDTSIIHVTSHYSQEVADEVLYLTCTKRQLRDLARWCNKNLLARVAYDSRPTLAVRIRIATSMLNKLDLPFEIADCIHDNILTNTYGAQVDYSMNALPF